MNRSLAPVCSPVLGRESRIRRLRLPVAVVCLFACSETPPEPEAPLVCGAIPQQQLFAGDDVDVTPCFEDPEGEMLTLSATSSDVGVVATTVSGSGITVEAISPGSATVTVVATDPDDLTAQLQFDVVVPNRPPEVCGTIPQQVLVKGQDRLVQPCFDDPDFEELTLKASSSDVRVATVSTGGGGVTITAVALGSAVITVVATDPGGLTAQLDIEVLVPNWPPRVCDTIPAQEMFVGSTLLTEPCFEDPEGEELTLSASSSDVEVATVVLVGPRAIRITAIAAGSATITAVATDPDGLSASLDIEVTVYDPRPNNRSDDVGVTTPSPRRSLSATAGWRARSLTP